MEIRISSEDFNNIERDEDGPIPFHIDYEYNHRQSTII